MINPLLRQLVSLTRFIPILKRYITASKRLFIFQIHFQPYAQNWRMSCLIKYLIFYILSLLDNCIENRNKLNNAIPMSWINPSNFIIIARTKLLESFDNSLEGCNSKTIWDIHLKLYLFWYGLFFSNFSKFHTRCALLIKVILLSID